MAKIVDPKMDNVLMPLGVDLFENLTDFLDQKLMLTSKDDFFEIVLSLQRGLDFSRSGGASWEPKSMNVQKMQSEMECTWTSIF